MFHTLHALNNLRSLDYSKIKIEIVPYLLMKVDNDILFELPCPHHPLGHYGQMQEWIRSTMITYNARSK
jgi:hypothetical protein